MLWHRSAGYRPRAIWIGRESFDIREPLSLLGGHRLPLLNHQRKRVRWIPVIRVDDRAIPDPGLFHPPIERYVPPLVRLPEVANRKGRIPSPTVDELTGAVRQTIVHDHPLEIAERLDKQTLAKAR